MQHALEKRAMPAAGRPLAAAAACTRRVVAPPQEVRMLDACRFLAEEPGGGAFSSAGCVHRRAVSTTFHLVGDSEGTARAADPAWHRRVEVQHGLSLSPVRCVQADVLQGDDHALRSTYDTLLQPKLARTSMRRRLAAFRGCGEIRPEERPCGPVRRRTVTTFCRAFGVNSAAESEADRLSAALVEVLCWHCIGTVMVLVRRCHTPERQRAAISSPAAWLR